MALRETNVDILVSTFARLSLTGSPTLRREKQTHCLKSPCDQRGSNPGRRVTVRNFTNAPRPLLCNYTRRILQLPHAALKT